jgi:hypothetical protein
MCRDVFGHDGGHDDAAGATGLAGAGLIVVLVGTAAGAASTDDRGPIIAGGVALFVAILTAVTTNRRQDRALKAERERLELQLDHDRQLVDVQDLRDALFEILDSYRALDDFITHARRLDRLHERWLRQPPLPRRLRALTALREAREVSQSQPSLDALMERNDQAFDRLRIRLAADDPLYRAAADLFRVFKPLGRHARQHDWTAYDECHRGEYVPRYRTLVAEAQRRVGSRTDPDSGGAPQ